MLLRMGDREHVLTAHVEIPVGKYKTGDAIGRFYQEAATAVERIPGVGSAAAINMMPVEEMGFNGDVESQNQSVTSRSSFAEYRWVTGGLLKTFRIPLIRGRWFSPEEAKGGQKAAAVIFSLLLIGLAAVLVPALRALRIDPIRVLRQD